ncbi:MAG TPA: class I SAM-dependent methyltransferase [Streptosporangiaceae bacterium]|nr:class I SAM-dependent methyltransferase [Streptosporangiaceae bacterium]
MLGIAARRADAQGITNVETRVCSADDLPFGDAAFDSISVRFGYMFFPDAARATAEFARVLKPGGRLCSSVWVRPEENPPAPAAGTSSGPVGRTAPGRPHRPRPPPHLPTRPPRRPGRPGAGRRTQPRRCDSHVVTTTSLPHRRGYQGRPHRTGSRRLHHGHHGTARSRTWRAGARPATPRARARAAGRGRPGRGRPGAGCGGGRDGGAGAPG